ncbi:MAG: hypothetical protein IBJ00_07410 [Alphaproteobacteria bacterium]|nr:hypothetical protein [Alphaproteobacteria bacterium]
MTLTPRKALNLGPLDVAIILREDGTMEASMPELSTDTVPDNVVTGAALMFALKNPEIYNLIHTNFVNECSQLDFYKANDD